ncbi:MAG: hypothetical protein PHD76_10590 [Methylacidiphilales bacterium]|nr:hypothetical protein [Candidatus Methylacidiphilales bacterium]
MGYFLKPEIGTGKNRAFWRGSNGNNALIVGTATYSGSDNSIAPGQHGIMLIPFEVVRETQPGSGQYLFGVNSQEAVEKGDKLA